jgi:hypothetical protein
MAASDKTNIKFVTIGAGAEAMGISINQETGFITTINDVAKPSKLINRGAANNYDCADMTNRVRSNFGVRTQNGTVVYTHGVMKATAWSNSLLTAGSGTGFINITSEGFNYTLDKAIVAPFNFNSLDNCPTAEARLAVVEDIRAAGNQKRVNPLHLAFLS